LAIFLSTLALPTHGGFLKLALRVCMAFALTVLMAAVSYAVLESPFLRLKKRFAHIDSRPV
jgi:peptidoglycan/LPS O-acetylase OafA/YrhL